MDNDKIHSMNKLLSIKTILSKKLPISKKSAFKPWKKDLKVEFILTKPLRIYCFNGIIKIK
jgi:hypothetical protein